MARKLIAVYDACVLYPNYLRDILIQLATANLFQAKWTEQIHAEWIRNLMKNRADISMDKLQGLKQKINQAVPDCLVTDFEYLIDSLALPDEDDRHVLASAIKAKADVIVTINLKDFPDDILTDHGLEAQHPDDFIANLIDLKPLRVVGSIQSVQTRLKNPPVSFDEYMEILVKQGLPISVSMLRQLQDQIV